MDLNTGSLSLASSTPATRWLGKNGWDGLIQQNEMNRLNVITLKYFQIKTFWTFIYEFVNTKSFFFTTGKLRYTLTYYIENFKQWHSNSCDCNWTRTQNHLVLKRTLNHLAKLALVKFKRTKSTAFFDTKK